MTLRMWLVRAGEEGRFYDDFKTNGIVAIVWPETLSYGNLDPLTDQGEVEGGAVDEQYSIYELLGMELLDELLTHIYP